MIYFARAAACIVRFGRYMLGVIAYSISITCAPAFPESTCLREVPNVEIDGRLSEWDTYAPIPLGVGRPVEPALAAMAYKGWSRDGIAIALVVHHPGSSDLQGASADSCEIFLDLRPRTARMDVYQAGVFRITVEPFGDRGAPKVRMVAGNAPERLAGENELPATFARGGSGWTGELMLPWKLIGGSPPVVGDWIGFSLQVRRHDGLSAKWYSAGAQTVEANNPLESSPIAFEPVRLANASTALEPFAWRVEEVVIGGRPWLEVEVVAPPAVPRMSEWQLTVAAGAAKLDAMVPMVLSPTGFRIAKERYDISHIEDRELLVRIGIPGSGWERETKVLCPVTEQRRKIEQRVPEKRLRALSGQQLAIAALLKECAQEVANTLSISTRDRRAPMRALRSLLYPEFATLKLNAFVQEAEQLIDGRKIPENFPFRAYRSRFDGAWIPLRISVPWNMLPGRKYPARIAMYGINRARSRSQFIENDLISWQNGQYYHYQADYFTISPYGRGNSHQWLGAEDFDHIFEELLPGLPIDSRSVGLYGGSFGAPVAFDIAMRDPGRYAWIYSRAGNLSYFLTQGDVLGLGRLANLRHVGVYMVAGEADVAIAASNERMSSALSSVGVRNHFRLLPDTGHLFTPDEPPEAVVRSSVPEAPAVVEFVTYHPSHGDAYWLGVRAMGNVRQGAKVRGEIGPGGTLVVEGTNVSAITLRRPSPRLSAFPAAITVNGQTVGVPPDLQSRAEIFAILTAGRWSVSAGFAADQHRKRKGLAGPAREIESRPLLIVYGTLRAEMLPHLRARAFQIMDERVGSDVNQVGGGVFAFRADHEVGQAELDAYNLWLVGGARDNAVARALEAQLPPALSRLPEKGNFLLSYIYPNRRSGHYLYVEAGTSPLAYQASVLPSPAHDICLQEVVPSGAVVRRAALFDGDWNIENGAFSEVDKP